MKKTDIKKFNAVVIRKGQMKPDTNNFVYNDSLKLVRPLLGYEFNYTLNIYTNRFQ